MVDSRVIRHLDGALNLALATNKQVGIQVTSQATGILATDRRVGTPLTMPATTAIQAVAVGKVLLFSLLEYSSLE